MRLLASEHRSYRPICEGRNYRGTSESQFEASSENVENLMRYRPGGTNPDTKFSRRASPGYSQSAVFCGTARSHRGEIPSSANVLSTISPDFSPTNLISSSVTNWVASWSSRSEGLNRKYALASNLKNGCCHRPLFEMSITTKSVETRASSSITLSMSGFAGRCQITRRLTAPENSSSLKGKKRPSARTGDGRLDFRRYSRSMTGDGSIGVTRRPLFVNSRVILPVPAPTSTTLPPAGSRSSRREWTSL